MKNRKGFVSNSSTSSFVILKKDDEMSFEDKVARSTKEINAYCYYGSHPEDIEHWVTKPATGYAENGKYILMMSSIDWNATEDIDKFLPKFLEKLGIDAGDITIEWPEE